MQKLTQKHGFSLTILQKLAIPKIPKWNRFSKKPLFINTRAEGYTSAAAGKKIIGEAK